jgi:hypothetical protein
MTERLILDPAALAQFTGTTRWFRHSLMRNVLYTEGVKYVADQAGAYWLVDKVASLQLDPTIAGEEFQVWKLEVHDNDSATLSCEDDNNNRIFVEKIHWTDFPAEGITLWYTDNVILLPSEY